MISRPFTGKGYRPQAGMVLLFCMIFLTALTLLGLSASADTVLQNQLAANLQQTERTRQSAMTALSWAEDWLLKLEGEAPAVCETNCIGLKLHPSGGLPQRLEYADLSSWQALGHKAGIDPLTSNQLGQSASGNSPSAMWAIELMHVEAVADEEQVIAEQDSAEQVTEYDIGDVQIWYRMLARGVDNTGKNVSVIESTVSKTWPATTNINTTDSGRVAWRRLR